MSEIIHIIPVGFDFQRLAQPITSGEIDADKIYLLHSSRDHDDTEVQQLAERMVDQLKTTLGDLFQKDVAVKHVDDIFRFETAYSMAYEMIRDESTEGNDVWINISSMPRTVAFAFASAANTLIVENPEFRDNIHTYYVSPEKYLVIQMIEELRKEEAFLKNLLDETDSETAQKRYEDISELVSDIDKNGVTKGAKQMNGESYVEFPAVPTSDLHDFEKIILYFLYDHGETESTSELAKKLAPILEPDTDPNSFKSKVQYNVQILEEKGFINRIEEQNRRRTQLGRMGKLWVETHTEEKPKYF